MSGHASRSSATATRFASPGGVWSTTRASPAGSQVSTPSAIRCSSGSCATFVARRPAVGAVHLHQPQRRDVPADRGLGHLPALGGQRLGQLLLRMHGARADELEDLEVPLPPVGRHRAPSSCRPAAASPRRTASALGAPQRRAACARARAASPSPRSPRPPVLRRRATRRESRRRLERLAPPDRRRDFPVGDPERAPRFHAPHHLVGRERAPRHRRRAALPVHPEPRQRLGHRGEHRLRAVETAHQRLLQELEVAVVAAGSFARTCEHGCEIALERRRRGRG